MTSKLTILAAVALLSAGLVAQGPCLGTQTLLGDDISLSLAINGSVVIGPVPAINPNDSVEFITGTIDYAGAPYYLLVEVGPPTSMAGIPGICVSGPATAALLPGGSLGFEGTFFSPITYPGGLTGTTVTVQSMAVTSLAANGAFATSDPLELTFN